MSIIDEIKQARNQLLSNDNKEKILARIKVQLIKESFAVIDGAKHYSSQEWKFGELTYVKAPYACHTAIAKWLEGLGFKTSRYYNNGGVDNGLKVWF